MCGLSLTLEIEMVCQEVAENTSGNTPFSLRISYILQLFLFSSQSRVL